VKGFETGFETVPIRWFDELDSTNAEARRLAEAGEAGPLWIAAHRQTQGRGRRGRAWETAQGNLAATLLVSPDGPPAEAAQLSFVAAFAVRAMARDYVPAELLKFKWPNDLLLAGRKLSGVLLESGRRADGGLWLAIGVGVNLAAYPEATELPATSIAAQLRPERSAAPSPEAALDALSEKMVKRISAWTRSGFEIWRTEWLKGAAGIGGSCVARLAEGRSLEGIAEGMDEDGALLLRLASGEVRRITAGDVFFGGRL
jgi:BirA family biotin operon repressor/biotin-[acetyl-CoA-carboxylase] ligase